MDFAELEAEEGLRWPWNAWPIPSSSASSKPSDLVVPPSVIHIPLSPSVDHPPPLPYDPLLCPQCLSSLNPYARVDYRSSLWSCPFCLSRNPFPRSYSGIADHNLPAELFPTHSTVEYLLRSHGGGGGGGFRGAYVFVVDECVEDEGVRVVVEEVRRGVAGAIVEEVLVGLVTFAGDVRVHEIGGRDGDGCSRVFVLPGDRDLSKEKIQNLLGISQHHRHTFGNSQSIQKQGFLLPLSECEFNFTTAFEEITSISQTVPGHRHQRATGTAIFTAVALLEACLPYPGGGGRIIVFTSGPATVGPGMIAEMDLSKPIRTHRDLSNGTAPFYNRSCNFYKHIAQRLSEASLVLDLFACSLDQVGAAELRVPVETSGGLMVLAESFESDQFRKCLRHIFETTMNFDATIEMVTTKEVKICGALGPCISLQKKNESVSAEEIGQGGTYSWRLGAITGKTCLAFIFQVQQHKDEPNIQHSPVFFLQFKTRYRRTDSPGTRLRVTTVARRWAPLRSPEIAAGFDQEAAAAVMARLAIDRAERAHARDVIRWIDKRLIRFASRFGDYIPSDPSSFRLASGFSLFPQFMYHLRRSQFIDVFNTSPDETAFFRLMLNREPVVGSLIMIQPTLFQYSFDGPPIPVLLDVSSIEPDVILLFDSYFYVVIHYGSSIAQWRKLGYDKDPNHENLRKLLEAPEIDAESLISERIPVPKLIKCDQHGSQARFLLAKLNPSITQNSSGMAVNGTNVIFTDDVSLQTFVEHLQALAVQP
ncbi:hypothetical protein QJS10_CPA08g00222 [Acorus calamus]|uniref:Protein transport protein SEC23 n=1 Tax=Acorus calamus TaxID=4465 RepID=A0AAV9E8R1_ACOCL|nr:hypothetical protein QJS10_CPA08g00222 [Acorus calamus]